MPLSLAGNGVLYAGRPLLYAGRPLACMSCISCKSCMSCTSKVQRACSACSAWPGLHVLHVLRKFLTRARDRDNAHARCTEARRRSHSSRSETTHPPHVYPSRHA
eukprot:5274134-Prymnesium_polylepis.1